nr:reverse transcriptase domain-containing protein [Tanacetum cinerariifolium]
MADNRTMEEMLQAPTEGYGDAIVVPDILAENFEIKTVSTTSSGRSSSTDARIDKLTDTISNLVENFNKKMTTSATVKAVQETCVICGGNAGFRTQVATNYRANQISPPGFPPVQNYQNRFNQNQNQSYNQNKGNNYQAPIQHPQVKLSNEFSKYKQITETSIRAMQNQIDNFKAGLKNEIHSSMQNQINNVKNELRSDILNQINKLRNMMASYFQNDTASTLGSDSLPSNTVANPRGDLNAITTRSGVSYDGPPIPPLFSSLPKVVERVPEVTKDTVKPSIENSRPSVAQNQVLIDEPIISPKPKPTIPYPSRVTKQKLREKDDNLTLKFIKIFKKLHFELSFADALLHIPKFALMFKILLNNKEKLFDLATTLLGYCSGKVDAQEIAWGEGIVLAGIVVGLLFRRPFLRTRRALIDVYGEELTLRIDDEAITFKVGQTSKYSYNDSESINPIDVIDIACEDFFIIVVKTPGSGISILLRVGTPFTGSGNLYCQWELSPGSGISILLRVGTPFTGSGNLYCQWELSPGSGNALCILFPTGNNDDDKSSNDDDDVDDVEKDEEDKEEEEHLAPTDPSDVSTDNLRKWESNHNGSLSQQNEIHKVPRAHTAWPINKKTHAGSLPLCNQCKFHHNETCTVKCRDCKKVGHIVQNFRTPATDQQTRTCYECGSLGHYKSECPIVKFHEHMDMIHGRMRASKPKTMQDAMEITTKLRNNKISTLVECETENKKRQEDMGYNRLEFYIWYEMLIMRLLACHSTRHGFLPPSIRECVSIRGWLPQPAHLSVGGMM